MPDISMCGGIGCKLKKKCYRYTATPNHWRQAYGMFTPSTDGGCQYFWDNKEEEEDA